MATPAAVRGDRITATCPTPVHTVPNPGSGAPQPAPPLPFSAPLRDGLAATVLVRGEPAAVQDSSGRNTPAHVGLHPRDPYATPSQQVGTVTVGSTTVLVEGKPAAKTGSPCVACAGTPAQLAGSAVTVLIGG